jgi:hypothetical protein
LRSLCRGESSMCKLDIVTLTAMLKAAKVPPNIKVGKKSSMFWASLRILCQSLHQVTFKKHACINTYTIMGDFKVGVNTGV